MKVVLDTNVPISAFLFEKQPGKIVKFIQQGVVTPCFIVSTFQELQNVLAYEKFAPVFITAKTTASQIVENIQNKSVISDDPEIIPDVIPDKNPDNYILAAAVAGDVKFIVTGDKVLLGLKKFQRAHFKTYANTPVVRQSPIGVEDGFIGR